MGKKPIKLEHVARRYPRVPPGNDGLIKDVLFVQALRSEYPAERQPRNLCRAYNSASRILDWILQCNKDKLRVLCEKHGMSPEGPRHTLIRRMWLHSRAFGMKIGNPIGYGKGFEKVGASTCACGFYKTERFPREEKKAMKVIRFPREENNKRFPRLQRFPRLKLFPRLKKAA